LRWWCNAKDDLWNEDAGFVVHSSLQTLFSIATTSKLYFDRVAF
jgi:hypothetical protein